MRHVACGLLTLVFACAVPVAAAAEPAPEPFTQEIPGTEARIEMVPIPGGTFTMGSPPGERPPVRAVVGARDESGAEEPQFEVEVEPFYMGKYEVTWDAYDAFCEGYRKLSYEGPQEIPRDRLADAVTYPTPFYVLEFGPDLQRMGQGPGFPAVLMSEYAAKQFTKWLSKKTGRFYRLPTEAEWEYACRAGTKTAYHFGDDPAQLKDYGWHYDNSEKDDRVAYRKVGQLKPNPWGLYDMHGNVAEIVIGAYQTDWYAQFEGRRVKAAETVDWPAKAFPRIARGGSYESEAEDLRSARRFRLSASVNRRDPELPQSPHWWADGLWIGFRVVSPVAGPPEAEKARWWDEDNERLRETLHKARAERQQRELIDPPAAER
jgi:sulfatase modifying factor 1